MPALTCRGMNWLCTPPGTPPAKGMVPGCGGGWKTFPATGTTGLHGTEPKRWDDEGIILAVKNRNWENDFSLEPWLVPPPHLATVNALVYHITHPGVLSQGHKTTYRNSVFVMLAHRGQWYQMLTWALGTVVIMGPRGSWTFLWYHFNGVRRPWLAVMKWCELQRTLVLPYSQNPVCLVSWPYKWPWSYSLRKVWEQRQKSRLSPDPNAKFRPQWA